MSSSAHTPVLLDEILFFFKDLQIPTFVDCTLGAAGHAKALLTSHPEIVRFVGIDQDPAARQIAMQQLLPWKEKSTFIPGNFRDFHTILGSLNLPPLDGILIDLGVSSMQLNMPEKGFSFMHEGPLDMRMDPDNPLTAAVVINTWSEVEIGKILRDYGEEKQWKLAARTIVKRREKKPFQTTKDLADTLYPILKRRAKKDINPLTLVFQGLRIFVNGELEALRAVLPQALKSLRQGGRLAVISFHSLEDRIVKHFFQYEASDKEDTSGLGGLFRDKPPSIKVITKKPVIANASEIERNPRSRSAKLRVIEKL